MPVTLPSGIIAGDLILVLSALYSDSGAAIPSVSGYTLIGSAATANNGRFAVFARTATGSDACDINSNRAFGIIGTSLAWRIAGGATPAGCAASFNTAYTGTVNCQPPAITGIASDFLSIVGGYWGLTSDISSVPAGYSQGRSTARDMDANWCGTLAAEKSCLSGDETPGAIILNATSWWAACIVSVRGA